MGGTARHLSYDRKTSAMPDTEKRKLLTMMTRQSDDVRFGVFATNETAYPLLMVEEDDTGGFDFSTARRVPFAEAFDLLSQLNKATGLH